MNDFELFPGDTPRLNGRVLNPDQSPRSLASATLKLFAADVELTAVIDNASQGLFHFDVPVAATDTKKPGRYRYKVKLFDGALAFTIISDAFRVKP